MKGEAHRRRSLRLEGYDCAQPGAHFVTICTQGRACLFGEIVNGEMQLKAYGQIVHAAWEDLPNHYPGVELDAFVVMPNHVHGIVVLTDINPATSVGAGLKPAPTRTGPRTTSTTADLKPAPASIGPQTSPAAANLKPAPTRTRRHGLREIVRAFKTFSARRINEHRGTPGAPLWQRNYYEHIIRDERSLNRIREYIADNPLQ